MLLALAVGGKMGAQIAGGGGEGGGVYRKTSTAPLKGTYKKKKYWPERFCLVVLLHVAQWWLWGRGGAVGLLVLVCTIHIAHNILNHRKMVRKVCINGCRLLSKPFFLLTGCRGFNSRWLKHVAYKVVWLALKKRISFAFLNV
jgi:hypothetical protein